MPVRERLVILLLAISLLLPGHPSPAAAAPLDDALARLAADNFPDTEKAIAEIAASGASTAEAVLAALADRRLFLNTADKEVYFKGKDGRHFDAKTGKPVASTPSDLSLVRVNNRLRGQIEAALGSLTLLSPDPVKRLSAAEAVFKSRDENLLGTLDTALVFRH